CARALRNVWVSRPTSRGSLEHVDGELVWAKFNRRPWWPCRVLCDPQLGLHTKMKLHSPRPCRMYFLETIGEMIECAWVPGKAIIPFKGSYQFDDLPKLRPRGKQKEKDYKYMVNYTRLTYIWNNRYGNIEIMVKNTVKLIFNGIHNL
uniref:PWWP domain-containing protein n=1 Tax=Hippocampus comes TaxID=109280 RepID=A0A3Q2XPK6_HIPCM